MVHSKLLCASQCHLFSHLFLPDLLAYGPVNALIIYPGSPTTSKSAGTWNGLMLRYKAVMRTSVWINFIFNSTWLLIMLQLQFYTCDRVIKTDPCDCKNNKEFIQWATLVIEIIGLSSCLVVEFYLRWLPKLLGLNTDSDYQQLFDDSLNELESADEKMDPVNDGCETLDTCLEFCQTIPCKIF